MWSVINDFLVNVDNFVWGVPLMVLIMAGGLLLTVRLGLLQIRKLPLALKWMIQNEEEAEGEISSFAALCTALSATIGTGNIVGVATAVGAGGPGALFWMVAAAFLGMATKYSEGLLAVKYRVVAPDGHSLGGPFYYIEQGMGKNWKWLAGTKTPSTSRQVIYITFFLHLFNFIRFVALPWYIHYLNIDFILPHCFLLCNL